ncbi:MAG: peptidoglycan DD-metalloendopeptidase family protein [Bacteroidaceae bacterium]|nr:peptidoglycan DD-metalloendopeptidase family protein [Bacteroidaceae bacterium]MBR5149086.1 peptidoglycan DD-metalloendopeptidase family protein [Bacteroidaceae bacterium]
MRRLLYCIIASLVVTLSYAQSNQKVKEMEGQRHKIEQQLAESRKLLSSTQKSVEGQLAQLSALSAQIKKQKQFVAQLDADVKAIDRELKNIESQMTTLQTELERRREHYAHALQIMTRKNTFENKLIFLLSADSFNQMVRRMRYLREYSGFQQKQGELLIAQQQELENKRIELEHTREAKKSLLAKRVEEKKELDKQLEEQNKLVAGLKKKQKEISNRIAQQQRERDKLNAEIERIIEAELRAQEAEQKKDGKDSETAASDKKEMPIYKESAADKKLTGSFESNRGKLPVPITGPYLLTSRYGINYVEGLKNVKFNNQGVDIRGQEGCSARAVFDGTVSFIFEHSGNYIVMVRHGQYISAYFNLATLKVKKGDKVKIHQPLGTVAADVSGNHTMQFQLRKDTQSLNPELWISF